MAFHAPQEQHLKDEKQWQLLKDTKKIMNTSLDGLRRLFDLFFEAASSAEQSMLHPRVFRQCLAKYGLRDVVLMSRLFKEFCEMPDRIDYRAFLGILCSVNQEPAGERLELLFDVWDMDLSNSLSYAELAAIVLNGVPAHEKERATERFNRIWIDIRQHLAASATADNDTWIGMNRSSGLTKEDLSTACLKMPHVREFFDHVLTRRSPGVNDNHRTAFSTRLLELEAELVREAKHGEIKENHGGLARSSTVPSLRAPGVATRVSSKRLEPIKPDLQPKELQHYKSKVETRLSMQQKSSTVEVTATGDKPGAEQLPPLEGP
jgi:hypothetical protein